METPLMPGPAVEPLATPACPWCLQQLDIIYIKIYAGNKTYKSKLLAVCTHDCGFCTQIEEEQP